MGKWVGGGSSGEEKWENLGTSGGQLEDERSGEWKESERWLEIVAETNGVENGNCGSDYT